MYRRLLKDSAVYSVSALLTRGLGFLLLPFYVRMLPPDQFGLYDYVTALGALTTVVVTLEIGQGLMRFVPERQGDAAAQARLIANVVWVTLGCYTIIVSVVLAKSRQLSAVVLGTEDSGGLLVVSVCLFMSMAFVYLWTLVGRALLRPMTAAVFSLSSAVIAGGAALVFLKVVGDDAKSLISGLALGQSVVAVAGFVYFRRMVFLRPELSVLRQLLKFSLPLVASSLAFTASMYIDRFVVRHFLGLDELAVYAVGARVAAAMSLLVIGLQNALTPLVYTEMHDPGTRVRLGVLFRWYVGLAVAGTVVMWVASDFVVRIVAGPDYGRAADVVVLLSLAVLIQSAYLFFPGLYVAGRTSTLAIIHVVGVIANVALSVSLVGVLGILGVALATLLAALLISLLNYRLAQRYFAVPILRSVAGQGVDSG